MIQMYKIQNHTDHISWFVEPTIRETRIKDRPNLAREIKPNTAQRTNFFTNRVANKWNKLSEETVKAKNINSFKNWLDLDLKGYYSSPKLFHQRFVSIRSVSETIVWLGVKFSLVYV